MSEEQQTQQVDTAPAVPTFAPITSQEQLNAVLGERLARERAKFADYDDLKVKATQFDEQSEAAKSETQKLVDKAANLEADAQAVREELTRERVARRHGLSDEDMELLSGDEEHMEKLAARIAAVQAAKPVDPAKAKPVPGMDRSPETRNIPLRDRIAAAEADGNKALVAELKAMMLAERQ